MNILKCSSRRPYKVILPRLLYAGRHSNGLSDEPPYFLPQHSSQDSEFDDRLQQISYKQPGQVSNTGQFASATNASNASDFRSVIDDLTIENKKLKQRLRRLEKTHSPHLENERLFEVTIHGLSARKRRKLEEKLREFTANLEDSSSDELGTSPPEDPHSHFLSTVNHQRRSKGSSNSNSRNPPDSAYASMSNDAQNSSSNLASVTTGREAHDRPEKGSAENAENIESFLDGIPDGLLPKANSALSEKQKQRIVVRRLEQLFTGKQALTVMDNQLAQQQEVADSAGKADDATTMQKWHKQGLREAHMLPQVDVSSRPVNMPVAQSRDEIPNTSEDTAESMVIEQEQRPTRPLDLDPDRAQVAADNVEYIRHLGLSTPQLLSEDSSDAESDAQGWVYLNLLINMAQLHIINVTPDFVRRAVKDVSHKIQLSSDGQKLRWRGGSNGTKLSSSDGASSSSPDERENIIVNSSKRRKTDNGRFAAVPVNVESIRTVHGIKDLRGFHYRPMFNHKSTSTDTSDSNKSGESSAYEKSFAADTGKQTESSKTLSGRLSRPKRRRDDGTMVFYSNAQFCTDLAGDRRVPTPLYLEPGQERGLSPRHILGLDYRRKSTRLSRFDSSSVKTSQTHKAASLQSTQSDVSDILIHDRKKSLDGSEAAQQLQDFEACGLGGTQPADHFVVRVNSRRVNNPWVRKPVPSSPSTLKRKMMIHTVPRQSLDAFMDTSETTHEEHLAANMSSLSASSPSNEHGPAEMPVEVEYLSAKFTRLEPSQLPEPLGYYGMSDDWESSYCGTTSSDSVLVQPNVMQSVSIKNATRLNGGYDSRMALDDTDYDSEEESSTEEEEEEDDDDDDDDDDDMSIDMLGHLRKIAPAAVAARENSFLRHEGEFEVTASAAATVAESVDES